MEPKFDDGHSITVNLLDGHQKLHQKPVSGQTSFFKTCFNGINALSGVGILSVPYALACGGWLSLMFLLIIAASTFYTGLLIQRCMVMDCRIKSYPDIGERAFGSVGRTVVSIVMNLELYMVATGFLILEGDNLDNLLPNLKVEIWGIVIGGKSSLVILIGLVILPTVLLNNMSILSYISASGVIASVTLLGSMLWASATDGIGIHADDVVLDWKGIPTAVSLYAFCYCAHPVFPTLYTSMENPTQFSKSQVNKVVGRSPVTGQVQHPSLAPCATKENVGWRLIKGRIQQLGSRKYGNKVAFLLLAIVFGIMVLILCFVVCTISYASMAILGYLMFGPNVLSQVTLNLPTHKLSSKVAILTTLINPIAKYALMVKPLVNAMENLFASHCSKKGSSLVIRTSLVISTVIVAVAIPLFGYLMSLVGAFLSITASVVLPCLCFLKISGIYRTLGVEMIMVFVIMVMGVAIMVVGTYTSVLEIVGHL